jgi:poly(A) polymerase
MSMGDPVIVPRAEHSLSRRQIDPEALKVLYRLHQANHTAYLVGGSVRDLLLERRPKDFDIGTSAHPYEVKKLFRNCWIIGRRFRLAHVKFGDKVVEVATFRRQVSEAEATPVEEPTLIGEGVTLTTGPTDANGPPPVDDGGESGHHLVHRDNTFGTPEEDAFRRDFTVNALFYDIGTFSVIDYTGGLEDLRAGIIRSIGDPTRRFQEDPVRMMRAVTLAARLGFTIDAPAEAAIASNGADLALSAPARLMEDLFKVLRSGSAERAFRMLAERTLLAPLSKDLQEHAGPELWSSLSALDAYRRRFETPPETLTNAVLLGTLLVPLGSASRAILQPQARGENGKEPRLQLGLLPVSRRDVERVRHLLAFQRRLADTSLSPRARRALLHRGPFREALTWLELHGNAPDLLEHWRGFAEATNTFEEDAAEGPAPRRRRRRRRRGRGRRPQQHTDVPEEGS